MTRPRKHGPAPAYPPDVVAVLTLRDGDVLDTWLRDGLPAEEFVAMLRRMADKFERGEVRRRL